MAQRQDGSWYARPVGTARKHGYPMAVWAALLQQRVPLEQPWARVSVHLRAYHPPGWNGDLDNHFKAVLDALRRWRLLKDDNWKNLPDVRNTSAGPAATAEAAGLLVTMRPWRLPCDNA